jgi:ribose transport system substrate-binding protein
MRKLMILLGALLLAFSTAQDETFDIVLVPGLTTDAFYITMDKGAQAAAEALGIDYAFQGAEEFNPTLQIPVLEAVIARQPDAILIAPTNTVQLI